MLTVDNSGVNKTGLITSDAKQNNIKNSSVKTLNFKYFISDSLKLKSIIVVGAFSVSGLIASFFIAWLILAPLNFSYGLWHDVGGIGAAIDKYGPQNRFKRGFAELSRAERIDLFAQINTAVHNSGKGLKDISYKAPGLPTQKLLRRAEIRHLQDVANLINKSWFVTIPAIIIWFSFIAFFAIKRIPPPSLKKQVVSIVGAIAVLAVLILLIGPTKVFSFMHVIAFPDSQWFFYYQNSLMSTMMWAPRLFGWIAIEWVLLSVGIFILLQFLAGFSVKKLLTLSGAEPSAERGLSES